MYKDITLKESFEKYLLMYSEKKSASEAYFGLSDVDFENSGNMQPGLLHGGSDEKKGYT